MSALNEIAHAVDAPSFDASFPLSSAAAILSALRAAGYAVVPVKPTSEMTLTANKRVAIVTPDGTWALGRDEAARTWTAMIAAAQEPTP